MPDAPAPNPAPDWKLALALFLQGVQTTIISEQCHINFNSLRSRIRRENWNTKRSELQAKLHQRGQSPIGILLPSVTEIGATVRQLAAAGLLKASEGLDQVRAPKSLAARRELAETVKAITDPGTKVFGWEDQKPSVVINLGQLKSARLPGDIEVQSQPVEGEENQPKLIDPPKAPSETDPPSA